MMAGMLTEDRLMFASAEIQRLREKLQKADKSLEKAVSILNEWDCPLTHGQKTSWKCGERVNGFMILKCLKNGCIPDNIAKECWYKFLKEAGESK